MKMTMSQPEALNLIADLMLEKLEEGPCDFVGGLAMGAVPIVNAISMRSHQTGKPVPLIWIRKEAKEYGTKGYNRGRDHHEPEWHDDRYGRGRDRRLAARS